MGRDAARDSANSEFYFMLDASRRLDRDYTVFGRIVSGMDVLLRLQHGEPPAHPDVMQTVRIMADIPVASRPAVKVPSDTAMSKMIAQAREEKGADFSVCDVRIPSTGD
jgi:peptidylprolyl isomerase